MQVERGEQLASRLSCAKEQVQQLETDKRQLEADKQQHLLAIISLVEQMATKSAESKQVQSQLEKDMQILSDQFETKLEGQIRLQEEALLDFQNKLQKEESKMDRGSTLQMHNSMCTWHMP